MWYVRLHCLGSKPAIFWAIIIIISFHCVHVQWSYGVTMWEIFSGGKSPYPATDPVSLIQMLERGERLPKPYNVACSDNM